jgi:hypothetical protein
MDTNTMLERIEESLLTALRMPTWAGCKDRARSALYLAQTLMATRQTFDEAEITAFAGELWTAANTCGYEQFKRAVRGAILSACAEAVERAQAAAKEEQQSREILALCDAVLNDAPAAPATAPAIAAIEYALEANEGIEFLRVWLHGQFDVIRDEWPDAPQSVYIAAPAPAEPEFNTPTIPLDEAMKYAAPAEPKGGQQAAHDQTDALTQLQYFVDAKRFDREVFPDQTAFGDWVVSRSRAILAAQPEQRAATLSDEQRSAVEAAILISEDIQAGRHDGAFLTDASVQALRALLSTLNGGKHDQSQR